MIRERIRLADLDEPLPEVEFRNGRVFNIREATARTERLRREVVADPTNEEKVRAVLKELIPDATDDDWECCTTSDFVRIYDIALRKTVAALALVETRRKNDGGETGGSLAKKKKPPRGTPLSSQTTTSITSAPKSGKSQAAGGAT